MKTFRVPVHVTMNGWVFFRAEDLKNAKLVAEHMNMPQVFRPDWSAILKEMSEVHLVGVEAIEEISDDKAS